MYVARASDTSSYVAVSVLIVTGTGTFDMNRNFLDECGLIPRAGDKDLLRNYQPNVLTQKNEE